MLMAMRLSTATPTLRTTLTLHTAKTTVMTTVKTTQATTHMPMLMLTATVRTTPTATARTTPTATARITLTATLREMPHKLSLQAVQLHSSLLLSSLFTLEQSRIEIDKNLVRQVDATEPNERVE